MASRPQAAQTGLEIMRIFAAKFGNDANDGPDLHKLAKSPQDCDVQYEMGANEEVSAVLLVHRATSPPNILADLESADGGNVV